MIGAALFILGAFLTAWGALIVQSLADAGAAEPFFSTALSGHWPPDDDNTLILDAPFVFVDSNGVPTVAPAGMVTDGASVGQLMGIPIVGTLVCRLIEGSPMTGPLRPAAIPHDRLYASATERSAWHALICSRRAFADRVIYEAARCKVYRVGDQRIVRKTPLPRWRAFIVFAILRLVGVAAWMSDASKAQASLVELARKVK